jgi:hypothetical protein
MITRTSRDLRARYARNAAKKRQRSPKTAAELFDWRGALAQADAILATGPGRPHIERPARAAPLVVRFALPLELARNQDSLRRAQPWLRAEIRAAALTLMEAQHAAQTGLLRRPAPLEGRPAVLACRFSSTEPDAYADGAKQAIDCLLPARYRKGSLVPGLGVIVDDRPSACRVVQWWEPAKRGEGFLYLEVRA